MKLGFGGDAQYSSKFDASRPRQGAAVFYQKLLEVKRSVILRTNDGWEVAFIANNITDKLTIGSLSKSNYAGGAVWRRLALLVVRLMVRRV